jgi:sialate O-acetylesterase
MNKLLSIILIFIAFFSQSIQSQSGGIYANFDNIDCAFSVQNAAIFQKVANPNISGINTSANVGAYTSTPTSTADGISNTTVFTKMDLSTMKSFKMKVLSPRIGNITFRLQNSTTPTVDFVMAYATNTKVGEWEDIYFDFPTAKTNLYDQILLLFDNYDNTHASENWYFDDIILTSIQPVSKVSVPNVFSNNMVLQQDMMVSIWGWAAANDNVVITGSWGETVTVKAGSDNKWTAKIQTPKAIPGQSPAYTLSLKGTNNTLVLSNILIGDVWLCTGQSNMQLQLKATTGASAEAAAANYPNIRLLPILANPIATPQTNVDGSWRECNPTNAWPFSAVAYYFGREVFKNTNIPIGLISAPLGASKAESYTKRETLIADPTLKTTYVNPYDANPTGSPYNVHQNIPGWMFNSNIAPILTFGIKGNIWYQGESNVDKPTTHTKLTEVMIKDWRTLWGIGDFPFYIVQLPDYSDTRWTVFRDIQTNVLTIPNTGMAVTLDTGESTNLHPVQKELVGKRLALWALAKTYGKSITYSGPMFKSKEIQGNKIIISYHPTSIGTGLKLKDGTVPREFKIAGADGVFYNGMATIVGNTVQVTSPMVANPVSVTYAYNNAPLPNLINKEGLPAAPFNTLTWNNAVNLTGLVSGIDDVNVDDNTFSISVLKDKLILYSSYNIQSADIYDVSGKIILKNRFANENNAEINTKGLHDGIYIVKVKTTEGLEIIRKFIQN